MKRGAFLLAVIGCIIGMPYTLATCCANNAFIMAFCVDGRLTQQDCCSNPAFFALYGYPGYPSSEQDCFESYYSTAQCNQLEPCTRTGCCCDEIAMEGAPGILESYCLLYSKQPDSAQILTRFIPGTFTSESCSRSCGYQYPKPTAPSAEGSWQPYDEEFIEVYPEDIIYEEADTIIKPAGTQSEEIIITDEAIPADDISAEKRAPQTITLGETIEIRITIRSNTSSRKSLMIEETFGSNIDFTGQRPEYRTVSGYKVPVLSYRLALEPSSRIEHVYQVTPRKAGEYSFSPATITDESGKKFYSNPVRVLVRCVQKDTCVICSTGETCQEKQSGMRWGLVLVVLLVLFAVFLFLDLEKRRAKRY